MTPSTSPLGKALLVLRALAQDVQPSVGVRELAAGLGMSPATAHRTLAALVNAGMVTHDALQGRYMLAPAAITLGLVMGARAPWRRMCLPHIRALTEATGEAASFAVVDRARLQMMTIAKTQSSHAVTVIESEGWKSLHAGAGGLAMLAFLSPADQADALKPARLRPETGATIVDPRRLKRELAAIASRGYALTRGQRTPGAVGVGAPVFSGGEVLGSIYVSLPEQRFASRAEAEISQRVRSSALALTRDLEGTVTMPVRRPKPGRKIETSD